MLHIESVELPESCPFSFRRLNKSLYLLRERDEYGEYPNIYAKICTAKQVCLKNGHIEVTVSRVIVLSDTGCGTNIKNPSFHTSLQAHMPEFWSIRTVLDLTINPGGSTPYLVMTTHCHYDHIMGIGLLPPTNPGVSCSQDLASKLLPTTVLSSAHDVSFISPWENIHKHSLAIDLGLQAPFYSIGMWAQDNQSIIHSADFLPIPVPTGFVVIHTPGHTPDSLTWYDSSSHLVCVGDSFYEATSKDTRNAKWGPEPRMPIMFDGESDFAIWWNSLAKVLQFVRQKNKELRQQDGRRPMRVSICSAHVTTSSPDAEAYILSVRTFFRRILRDEVPHREVNDSCPPNQSRWYWDDELEPHLDTVHAAENKQDADFSWFVMAPKTFVDAGRVRIPKDDWQDDCDHVYHTISA